jgi:predicted Rossmann fold flavoprotein
MDISGALTEAPSFDDRFALIDLLPWMEEGILRSRLVDRAHDGGRKRVTSLLADLLPSRLAVALATQANAQCTVAELSRHACQDLLDRLKRLPMHVTGTMGFDKAEVTAGGVSLKEVDPRTMASRIAKGLYIAGEVLDVDGPIGGYNFQAAFSTGRAAGIAAASRE